MGAVKAPTIWRSQHASGYNGGWMLSGLVRVYRGEPEAAIERLARALRLSPLDPLSDVAQNVYAPLTL